MGKMNPIEQSKFINEEFKNFLKSTFTFAQKEYDDSFKRELDNEALFKGPYLNANLPFTSGLSLNDLIKEGIVSKEFTKINNCHIDRPLYSHQEESMRKIMNGKNAVVTTGTGSGKTECFLFPIINSILKDIESGNNNKGIRAIFLYPMNALVNDQIGRVRELLCTYPQIKYGFFTGETPLDGSQWDKDPEGYRKQLEKENRCTIPENELITRSQIREELPHLLFTNYSMLERMLIGPKDSVIFDPVNLGGWKFVVLDEAHTYNGALGIELALLLRRLTGLAEKKPQFILTSATLGKKGESEQEIIDFAMNLTSAKFAIDDIIFDKRLYLNNQNVKYSIAPKDYFELENNLEDVDKLNEIVSRYDSTIKETDKNVLLYKLLLGDQNVYTLYRLLDNGKTTFKEAFAELYKSCNFKDEKELVSLIFLINQARDGFKFIYDIKYHLFLRALDGGFVTLGNNKTLKIKSTKTINNQTAFEVGNCRKCNATYLMGRIFQDRLVQNSEVDIYDNLGEEDIEKMSFFLLDNEVNKEEINIEDLKEYTVCSKCGHIIDDTNLNASEDCDCGKEYKVKLLKAKTNASGNNIDECPCCKKKATSGIVRSLSLGKDEATALLGQILYQAIDEGEEVEFDDENEFTFDLPASKKKLITEGRAKQFIAFSDSRQQAAFFAQFFDDNYDRFMTKRVIYKALENNEHEPIKLKTLVNKVKEIVKTNHIIENYLDDEACNKKAWAIVLKELLLEDGSYSGEGLGIYNFRLDISDILDQFKAKGAIEKAFGQYGLNNDNFYNYLSNIFRIFRNTPAIDYSDSGLTSDEKEEALGYRQYDNSIMLEKGLKSDLKDVHSFLPVNGRSNDVLEYTTKVCNVDIEKAKEIVTMIFSGIGKHVFSKATRHENDETFKIDANKYTIFSYKKSKLYKCSACGEITSFNVNNICFKSDCLGHLEECDPDEVLKTSYYRKEYMTRKIEPLVTREHTAQLSKKEAKEYQNDFKEGKINVLSCSTTFEMGVDIGSLETVFMRNVPPSPANYVQRAGRAGRRKDSSALILTFCNNSSHDYSYFERPDEMIKGIVQPPNFRITNEKIILRHLLSAAFGLFFKKNADCFEKAEKLVCDGGLERFKEYVDSKPKELKDYIDNKILDNDIRSLYGNFKWWELACNEYKWIEDYQDRVNDLILEFEKEVNKCKTETRLDENVFDNSKYYLAQIKEIKEQNVIEDLSNYGIIPKYGFPVDVVNLDVYEDGRKNNKFDLSRDLQIAISEYAPESELIVNKTKYTSRYISFPTNGFDKLTKYFYKTCSSCNRVNIVEVKEKLDTCEFCGKKNTLEDVKYFIIPKYGFKTGENKKTNRKKPIRTYSGEKEYLGRFGEEDSLFKYNKSIEVETTSNDRMAILNKSNFFTCNCCGYTKIDKKAGSKKEIVHKHMNVRDWWCNNSDLQRVELGHIFKTDVAKLNVKGLADEQEAYSLLYAMLEGMSKAFNIERTDIDGVIVHEDQEHFLLVFYDNVPGGAGHVKRLQDKDSLTKVLEDAKIKVSQNCCDEDSSCNQCLRNYYNQRKHKYLSRKAALRALDKITR